VQAAVDVSAASESDDALLERRRDASVEVQEGLLAVRLGRDPAESAGQAEDVRVCVSAARTRRSRTDGKALMPEREEKNAARRLHADAIEGDELAQGLLLLDRAQVLQAELAVSLVNVVEHSLDHRRFLVRQAA